MQEYEVVIVGGGPAGLSAALVLGRCLRKVCLCDAGEPRNIVSQAMHGYLTRDNIPPAEFLDIARQQLAKYKTVDLINIEVINCEVVDDRFVVTLQNENRLSCRKLLLATGVVDILPEFEGFKELYGKSIFHCPYCDAWEFKGLPIVIYGRGLRAHGLSLNLKNWTDQVFLCSDGPSELSAEERKDLEKHSIVILEDEIECVQSNDSGLQTMRFRKGKILEFGAMFFTLGQKQRSHLPEKLGCDCNEKGAIETNNYQVSSVPNLYVAGDASEELQLVIVAAAEGAKAAFAINKSLTEQDIKQKS